MWERDLCRRPSRWKHYSPWCVVVSKVQWIHKTASQSFHPSIHEPVAVELWTGSSRILLRMVAHLIMVYMHLSSDHPHIVHVQPFIHFSFIIFLLSWHLKPLFLPMQGYYNLRCDLRDTRTWWFVIQEVRPQKTVAVIWVLPTFIQSIVQFLIIQVWSIGGINLNSIIPVHIL